MRLRYNNCQNDIILQKQIVLGVFQTTGRLLETLERLFLWKNRSNIKNNVRLDNGMFTVLMILGTIFALFTVPVATIPGLLGFWIFGFWGALIGIVIGLLIQFGNK